VWSKKLCFAVVAGCLFTSAGRAETDRPERGVARISVIHGDVSVRRGDTNDWTAAAINAPMVVGDRIYTGTNSRAEVQFDWANMIRLGPNSEVRMADLQYERYVVQVAEGITTWRVLRDRDADVEISTPTVSVRPMRRGEYRVQVRPDGTTEITVRSGEAEIFTPTGVERLRPGRTMMARGTPSDPEFQLVREIPRDDWDNWNERRDRDLERSRSYRYVSSDIYGAEDLDNHGRWVYVAPYGHVWTPFVGVGWAPYRFGRWVWLDWYGWTWLSYDPWGWAPYHFGRWFWADPFGWCWFPGPIGARHFWSPGLVAWIGWNNWGGFRGGFGFGFGRVGWIPLAPFEPFYPWYGRGFYGGFRNRVFVDNSVNIVNNVNVTNIYRNARVRNGVTIVDGEDFRHGRVRHVSDFDRSQLASASQVRGQLPMVPERASLRYADREVRRAVVEDRGGRSERFYTRRGIEPVQRVSFEDQRSGMQEIARRTFGTDNPRVAGRSAPAEELSRTAAPGLRSGEPSGRIAELGTRRTAEVVAEQRSNSGWRRFGEPRSVDSGTARSPESGGWRRAGSLRSEEGRTSREASPTDAGWRRFGEPMRDSRGDFSGRGAARDSGIGRSNEGFIRRSTEADAGSGEGWRGRSIAPERSAGGGSEWRRFGDSGRGDRFGGSIRSGADTPRGEFPRNSAPTSVEGDDRGFGRGGDQSGGRLRINPRIVEPRTSGGDASYGRSMDRGSDRSSRNFSTAPPRVSSPGGGYFESGRGSYGLGTSPRSSAPMGRSERGGFGGAPSGIGRGSGGFGGRSSPGMSMPSGRSGGGFSGGRSGGGYSGGRSSGGGSRGGGGRE
jgi:hypothetical protein